MDQHLVLILAEVLKRIALTRVVIKDQNHELLRKFIFQYVLEEGRIGCNSGDGPETSMMWHTHFFDSLLYELVEILDTNELDFPLRLIRSIPRAGMSRTRPAVGLLRWSGGGCSTTPLIFRLLATCSLCNSGPLWRWKRYSGILEGHNLGEELVV